MSAATYSDNWVRLASRWAGRAGVELHGDEPFAAFFFAYMAMMAAAARGLTEERNDSEMIVDYFGANEGRVGQLAETARDELDYFATRTSDPGAVPVLQFMGAKKSTEERYYPIVRRLSGWRECSEAELGESVAVLLVRIRNNLFHGNKDYDSESDAAVLGVATRLILSTLWAFDRIEAHHE